MLKRLFLGSKCLGETGSAVVCYFEGNVLNMDSVCILNFSIAVRNFCLFIAIEILCCPLAATVTSELRLLSALVCVI